MRVKVKYVSAVRIDKSISFLAIGIKMTKLKIYDTMRIGLEGSFHFIFRD